jgi:hypothetical protein
VAHASADPIDVILSHVRGGSRKDARLNLNVKLFGYSNETGSETLVIMCVEAPVGAQGKSETRLFLHHRVLMSVVYR